jgi:hypothetical protein
MALDRMALDAGQSIVAQPRRARDSSQRRQRSTAAAAAAAAEVDAEDYEVEDWREMGPAFKATLRWVVRCRPQCVGCTHMPSQHSSLLTGVQRCAMCPRWCMEADGLACGPCRLLEWPRLCEHVASFASTSVGKRMCRSMTVPEAQAESERMQLETK